MRSGYISIIGAPNSGKSLLLNRILGEQLSIVTAKPQTTRRNIVGIHNIAGAQMIFIDTPGVHKSEKPLNQYLSDEVNSAVKDADVVCLVADGKAGTAVLAEERLSIPAGKVGKIVIAVNKLDLVIDPFDGAQAPPPSTTLRACFRAGKEAPLRVNPEQAPALRQGSRRVDNPWGDAVDEYKRMFKTDSVVGVSAKTGHGVDVLVAQLAGMLPEGEALYPDDIYTKHPVRFLVSEIIREQIFLNMHQEIPYSTAVVVDEYKETPALHRILASIIVEKNSQKGMLIGKGGCMLKKIGELARARIEQLAGCRVYLELFVRVEKNWTKDRRTVKQWIANPHR